MGAGAIGLCFMALVASRRADVTSIARGARLNALRPSGGHREGACLFPLDRVHSIARRMRSPRSNADPCVCVSLRLHSAATFALPVRRHLSRFADLAIPNGVNGSVC